MMIYGESDYWVAQYRSRTEGSAKPQARPAKDPRRSWVVRGAALVKALSSRIVRRGVQGKAGFDGRA